MANEIEINVLNTEVIEEFNLESEAIIKPSYSNQNQFLTNSNQEQVQTLPIRSYLTEIRLDNTKRSTAVRCLRKFQLSHMLGLKSIYGSTALRYGSCFHAFMEGFYGTIKQYGWAKRSVAINNAILLGKKSWDESSEGAMFWDDYRTFENCTASFINYITHFEADQNTLEVIATEQVFSLNMELETDIEVEMFGYLPPIVYTGKLDLQMKLNETKWIDEFKTTGQSLSIQEARLYRSPQIIGYSYAAKRVLNFDATGALVTLHQLFSRKGKSGEYGKVTIDFSRTPQIFTDDDIFKWKMSFLKTCGDIYQCEKSNYFPCQFDSCFDYNRKCQFYGLCTSNTEPSEFVENIPEGFKQQFWDVELIEDGE